MAIQQVLTVYLNLKGDGASSAFVFALQNLYQFSNGIAVPFGGAGVVPTAVSANNPPVPVTSTTIDANGNITLTTTSALPASVFTFQLDLTFTSGSSTSSSATQTTNVTVVGSSATQILDSGGTNKATVSAGGALKVDGSAVTQPISGTVAATQSGTWNIGTLTTITNPITVVGDAASGATKAGNPVQGGAVFNTTQPTVTNGQVVENQSTARGGLIVATGVDTFTVAVSGTVAVTQSGTWTVQPGNTANTTPWLFTINQGGNSASVSASNALKVDGSAVTQPVSGTVTANIGTTGGITVAQGSTTSGQSGPLMQGAVTTSAPTYTTAQTSPLSLDTSGNLRVVGSFSSGALPDATTAISLTAAAQTAVIAQAGRASIAFNITSVGTAGVVITEASVDGGTNWFQIDVWSEALETWVTGNISVTGTWWIEPLGALSQVRVRCVSITSGTITGTLLASTAPMGTFEYQGSTGATLPFNAVLIGGSDGTNLRNLKTDTSGTLFATSADTATGSTALNALNAAISIALTGQASVGFQLAAGTLIGTIVPELSYDGGTTWFATQFKDPVRTSYFSNYIFAASNTATFAAVDTAGGVTNARVRVSAFTSGTANAIMNASKIGHTTVTVSSIDGQKVTYSASVRAFTPVASATSPIVLFTGSSTKICRITKIVWSFSAGTGSTTFPNWSVQRFSTITGGTVANTATAAKNDINDPAATATVTQYSTVPTTATANGGIAYTQRFQWTTASATVVSPVGFTVVFGSQPGTKELVTRSATDFFGILLDSIGTTPVASITIEWTEE